MRPRPGRGRRSRSTSWRRSCSGYFVTRLQERLPLSSYRRPLLGTGLCGGLSTFSTMQVEILKMLDAHAWGLAAGYAAASIAAGYAAIHLATAMVRRVRVRAMSVLRLGRGRADRRGGVGAAVPGRRRGVRRRSGRDFPFGTLVVNMSGAVILGPADRARPRPRRRRCWPAPRPSARTRRSRPGCWRPSGWPRSASTARRSLNVVVSLVLGVAAAALGRLIGAHL